MKEKDFKELSLRSTSSLEACSLELMTGRSLISPYTRTAYKCFLTTDILIHTGVYSLRAVHSPVYF